MDTAPERAPLLAPLLPLGNRITLGTQTEIGVSPRNSDYLSMVHSREHARADLEMQEILGGKQIIRMNEMG